MSKKDDEGGFLDKLRELLKLIVDSPSEEDPHVVLDDSHYEIQMAYRSLLVDEEGIPIPPELIGFTGGWEYVSTIYRGDSGWWHHFTHPNHPLSGNPEQWWIKASKFWGDPTGTYHN